jgi:serine/threonine-protein kinase
VKFSAGLTIADRFCLVRKLGQGGMGSVWLARHTGLDIPCAVKLIHEDAARSPELRVRFEREAKAAAQLRTPHVVQILDHGVWNDQPYIAMEYLEGEDLGARLARVGRLSPAEILPITVQIGRALTRAHAAGLVHRDLKPSNVFLVRDDEREIAKVLDFGVAKVTEVGLDGSTSSGALLGTPYYMSPEQAKGEKGIDHRSDLWALGVVVFQCLVGRAPFTGRALGELFVNIIVEPLPVPSQIAPVPPGFDAWWTRAAARDPNERFQTAKDLIDALALALGLTIQAGVEIGSSRSFSVPALTMAAAETHSGPVPPAIRVSAPLRRRQGLLAALLVAAVIGSPAALFAWWGGAHGYADGGTRIAEAGVVAEPSRSTVQVGGVFQARSVDVDGPPPAASSAAPVTTPDKVSAPRLVSWPTNAPAPGPVTVGPAVPKRPPARPKANCDPNFSLDSDGNKHFKPECFK